MSDEIFVIGVNGGRPNGTTDEMLNEMLAGCSLVCQKYSLLPRIKIRVRKIQLGSAPWKNASHLIDPAQQGLKDIPNPFLDTGNNPNGLILATPVRYGHMSSLMAKWLEWVCYFSDEEEGWPLQGLPVGYGACGDVDGGKSAVMSMESPMMEIKTHTVQDGHFYTNTAITGNPAGIGRETRFMVDDAALVGVEVAAAAIRRYFFS